MMTPTKLTEKQLDILRQGARHPDGVVRPSIAPGFEGVSTRKNVRRLEALGLIEPNAHGDHYITDDGRRAVADQESQP